MNQCKQITRRILNEEWTFRTLSKAKYTKLYGKDSAAVTEFRAKTVSFIVNDINHDDVAHELTHVVYHQMNTNSANLDQDQMEEVMAEINGKCWHLWAQWTHDIMLALSN
jgi:selenocysteine lyase/cysteine desulfurase